MLKSVGNKITPAFGQSERTDFSKSKALQGQVHNVIPGGCHTLAKGDDQFPVLAPGFIERGLGSHVWDIDGNEYIEYGMGCRAVTLGHAFPPVVEAVREELGRGSNFGRPSPIEFDCAQALLDLIEGAEMCKFAKDGSAATTAALKLARAKTRRDKIAFCGDHPFFATNDWFIGTTEVDAGIPEQTKRLSLGFKYNDIDSLRALFRENPGQIAAVILEPAKYDHPKDGFLHKVKDLCHQEGAVFILDEMITGFRWHNGGAQKYYDITPDLSTFGKALANGMSVSALVGKRDLMELGGLEHDSERVFLLSTTHGAETHALAGAIATMQVYRNEPVVETLWSQGEKLKRGLERAIADYDLAKSVKLLGPACCMVIACADGTGRPSQEFRTLMLQETIKQGLIIPSLVVSYSHTDSDIEATLEAFDRALFVYRKAIDEGVGNHLVGRPSKSVYRRFN
ncbi:MAG: glutamate-1-semialdehyde 2,1-aminomutase [Rhizobiaceae bacterium]|nr:glutamate-1-semialdehyde 2,1-aminomutase [Rhizobiaceae bacterium]